MRLGAKLLLMPLLLGAVTVWGQERYHAEDLNLLARLSYQRSPMADRGSQQICITVSRTGNYRLLFRMSGKHGFEGKMTPKQLLQLKRLLAAHALRSLPENEVGIIRDHSESFMAEISRIELPSGFQLKPTVPADPPRSAPGLPRRVQWLNADDDSPFPVAMAKVIDWMKTFTPQEAHAVDDLELSEVCPSVGLSFVQPSIATNKRP